MVSAPSASKSVTNPNRPIPNLETYLTIRAACYALYHDQHSDLAHAKPEKHAERTQESAAYVREWPTERRIAMGDLGDPESVLENAMRCVRNSSSCVRRSLQCAAAHSFLTISIYEF